MNSIEVKSIFDVNLILIYLCQVDFKDKALKKKLKKSSQMKRIFKKFKDYSSSSSPCTGYYELPYEKVKWITEQTTLLEQIKLRIHNERTDCYSVSLNLLLNELQLICFLRDTPGKELKNYDSNAVTNFLESKGIAQETRLTVTKLFSRRNNNGISHPGSIYHIPVTVSKKEYKEYQAGVHEALQYLLQDN